MLFQATKDQPQCVPGDNCRGWSVVAWNNKPGCCSKQRKTNLCNCHREHTEVCHFNARTFVRLKGLKRFGREPISTTRQNAGSYKYAKLGDYSQSDPPLPKALHEVPNPE